MTEAGELGAKFELVWYRGGSGGRGGQLELDSGVGRLACGYGVENKVRMPFESQIHSEPSSSQRGLAARSGAQQ